MHMPKTGGMSTSQYLHDQYIAEQIYPKRNIFDIDIIELQCMKYYSLISGHFDVRVINYLPNDITKVTFFREPVSLTISAIKHAIRDLNFSRGNLDIEGKTLQQIIRDDKTLRQFCNVQIGYLSSLTYFENYPNLLKDDFSTDDMIINFDQASKNLKLFDFVGIFEEYNESITYLANLMGFYEPKLMPKLNVAPSNSDDFLSNEDLDLVRKYNELDIKLYQEAYEQFLTFKSSRKTISNKINFSLINDLNYIEKIPFNGFGFYELELAEKGYFRWTGVDILSGMSFNSYGIKKCVFLVEYCFIDTFSNSLDFYINSVFVEPDITDFNGLYKAKLVYDNTLLRSKLILLEFKTDVVKSSKVDSRKRGLIISNVSVISCESF